MAEQAINTIYALGEHPDALCGLLIQNLTRRAFATKPSASNPPIKPDPDAMDEDPPADATTGSQPNSAQMGDAFLLSQLLFVVGHVALKQVVYLELVEREWKRQEDEKIKGAT
jgi:condensin complex subunit 1